MDVTDNPRIEELRRRVQKDPTSIAFAQLAEEYRRVGDYQEAVNVCRSGLARHPSYLSARVTLGRALMELEKFNDAQAELEAVLDLAPDNLAAIRALAEIHQRRGEAGETFHEYTDALEPPREEAPPAPRVEDDEPAFEIAPEAGGPEGPPLQTAHDEPATGEVEADPLDAIAALTLDLPPPPDFSSWSLDTNFSLPDFLPDSLPVETKIALPAEAKIALPAEPKIAQQGGGVIDELQQWLAAIVSDRSNER